jgi:hypothetical protein
VGVADSEGRIPFVLSALKPVILLDGKALDQRFLGAWEGTMSLRKSTNPDLWYDQPTNAQVAKVRVELGSLGPHDNLAVLVPKPGVALLPDGNRFEATGVIKNAQNSVKLYTGECVPALTSFTQAGALNPIPVDDYTLRMWRFPMMHTLNSYDYHVVLNYPKGLNPNTMAMATRHNFHVYDYISPKTTAVPLTLRLHGTPVNQIVIVLTPVADTPGAGEECTL